MRKEFVLLSVLMLLPAVLAITSEDLSETATNLAAKFSGANITTSYDNFVKPLLPFTCGVLITDTNATVKATIMPDYSLRINDERKEDVLVKINSSGYSGLYDSLMKGSSEGLVNAFNSAGVTVTPKSVKAETALNLVKKYTPLEFTIEKEKGVVASFRSAVSTIISAVISFFAKLLGLT